MGIQGASAVVASPPPSERPPWNSPVPYIYGGLVAMAGLLILAILILACSYWKLYGYLRSSNNGDRDVEVGEVDVGDGSAKAAPPPVLEEKYLVIMAGQKNPTFVATPRWSGVSSFGCSTCGSSSNNSSTSSCESSSLSEEEEEKKMEYGERFETRNTENPLMHHNVIQPVELSV